MSPQSNADKELRRVVFLHLPKVGGTTLHELLSQNYAKKEVCRERFDRLTDYSEEDLSQYELFSGHYSIRKIPTYLEPYRIICVFRNPRDRLLSQYYYFKTHTWEYVKKQGLSHVARAKEHGLLDFLRLQETDVEIGNVMTKSLSNIECKFELGKLSNRNDVISSACKTIDSITCLGLTERMDESVDMIFSQLGFSRPHEVPRMNATGAIASFDPNFTSEVNKEDICVEIEEEITRLTSMDKIVYEYAKVVFFERLADYYKDKMAQSNQARDAYLAERDVYLAERDAYLAERGAHLALQAELNSLRAKRRALLASRIWRLTAPLRALRTKLSENAKTGDNSASSE